MKPAMIATITALSLALSFGSALAKPSSEPNVTEYDFEADDFTAKVRSPEGLMLSGEKQSRLRSLIRIRKNFKREIVKAADGI